MTTADKGHGADCTPAASLALLTPEDHAALLAAVAVDDLETAC
jgi:hypothetical protein